MKRKLHGFARDLSSEAQSRRSALSTPNNTSEKGRKGRAASGWNRAPMCSGLAALASWNAYRNNAPK